MRHSFDGHGGHAPDCAGCEAESLKRKAAAFDWYEQNCQTHDAGYRHSPGKGHYVCITYHSDTSRRIFSGDTLLDAIESAMKAQIGGAA